MCASLFLVYTLLGGFWAVSITDTIQGLLMIVTAILLPVAAILHLGGPVVLDAGTLYQWSELAQHRIRPVSDVIAVGLMLAGFVRGQLTVCFILGSFYAIALSIAAPAGARALPVPRARARCAATSFAWATRTAPRVW